MQGRQLGFMLTISLNFGVRSRNWPRTGLQPLKFNFELCVWRFRGDVLPIFRKESKW